jgi:ribosomal protein S18 acetylase RimI-like enzyme
MDEMLVITNYRVNTRDSREDLPVEIRPAGAADRDAVVALWVACDLTRPWNDPVADFDRATDGPASAVLVGIEDGALLGAAMVGDDGHRGWVYYVAVRPDARGQGHGGALMHAAETWLRDRGVPKVQLMVRDTNEAVLGFYASLGYERNPVHVLARWLDRDDVGPKGKAGR